MQAALLDLGAVGALAQLLARLVAALGGGPAGDAGGPAEAAALATMALEVATALTNPAIALNPAMPAPQRTREECPLVEEVGFQKRRPCLPSFPCDYYSIVHVSGIICSGRFTTHAFACKFQQVSSAFASL